MDHTDGCLLLPPLSNLSAILFDKTITAIIALLSDECVNTVDTALKLQFRVNGLRICIQLAWLLVFLLPHTPFALSGSRSCTVWPVQQSWI